MRVLHEALVNRDGNYKDVIGFCGENFTAYAKGISNSSINAWSAKASLSTFDPDTGAEGAPFVSTSSTSSKRIDLSSLNSEEVTSWFKELAPLNVFLKQSDCENIVVVANLSVLDSTGMVRYTGATTGRLWCDSSDVDLALTLTGNQPTAVTDLAAESSVSLPIPASDMIKANVTGFLKPLANKGCYFATAFFTRHFEMKTSGPYTNPGIDAKSIVLATSCFFPANISSVDFRAMLTKTVVPKGLCGSYQLVLLLDALNAAFNEPNKKNNYVTFLYNVSCETEDVCEVVENGWSAKDARVFLRSPMEDSVFMDDGRWTERRDTSHSDIERYGYGALKVIGKYLKDQTNQCKADLTSADAVARKVSEMEGINAGPAVDTTDIADLLTSYEQTKAKLIAGTADNKTAIYDLRIAEMTNKSSLNFRELLKKHIEMGGLLSIINASHPSGSNRTSRGMLCHLDHTFEKIAYLFKDLFLNDQIHHPHRAYLQETLAEIVGNLTAVSLLLKKQYPGFDCLETMVKRVIKILHLANGGSVETSMTDLWDDMLDGDYMNAMKVNNPDWMCGGMWNRCLRKIAALCERCDMEQEVTSDDVCRMLTLKKFARDYATVIGLHHLDRYGILEGEYKNDTACKRERLIATREILTFWKQGPLRPNDPNSPQCVMKGHMSPDNRKICWRKRAMCTCDACSAPSAWNRK
ncbi:uncharacterized protein LOC127863131 [Dreissena polymorpha]|nr:uncharacterized protein LOC127863131 [Dreissena polymorpha]